MFRDVELISEDVILMHDIRQGGYNTNTFPWLQAKWMQKYEGKNSIASSLEKERNIQ